MALIGQMLNLRSLKITPEILKLVAEIDEFKGSWRALEKHTTALQLLGDVAQFGQNFKSVLGPLQDRDIDEQMLTALHVSYAGKNAERGFRTGNFPLIVQQGENIIGSLDTASPEDIRVLTPKLLQWLDESLQKQSHHPLIVIALFTSVFLQICPFETGNQKIARLLIVLLMLREGYLYAPYITLDDLFMHRAQDYFDALQQTKDSIESGKPDWQEWIVFFLGLLKFQKDKLLVKLETKDKDLSNLPTLSARVMRLFEEHKRLQMNDLVKLTNGRRSTLKLRLNELVDDGYLHRHGKARATWYSLV